ncbi:MAG TPA: 6-phosphogluconolactonase [Clostridia bacterium]|nr:6-phosphogluconolactonase [Clostridia bacterium]
MPDLGHTELKRFAEADNLAKAAAADWWGTISSSSSERSYCVALAGGRIALNFFDAVVELAKGHEAALSFLHFFWGDERCVPPQSEESNFRLANEHLLKPLAIPANRIHRLRGEDEPAKAAAEAEAELRLWTRTNAAQQPILDMVFLGMGEEGHVASLFPGESEELMRSQSVYRPVMASKPPPQRITLGYPVLAAAQQVWVLASGAGKQSALREALAPNGQTPLGRVLRQRTRTVIYTDLL